MNKKFWILPLLVSSWTVCAQDEDPFADLDAELAEKPKAEVKPKETPKEKPSAKSEDDFSDFEEGGGDDMSLDSADAEPSTPDNSTPDAGEDDLALDSEDDTEAEKTPAPKDEGLREVLNPKGDAPDADLEDLEKTVEAAEAKDTMPPALLTDNDPGEGLDPSDQFYRVPLHPPMSDANWAKWAGPVLEKIYRVRRGDSLWVISERLFGNPFLWPKVWQLNAGLENPHMIEVGTEMQFLPGGPSAAPVLAYKWAQGSAEIPFTFNPQPLGFIEQLETLMRRQGASSDPPFKYFLLDELPEEIERMPVQGMGKGFFYSEGSEFHMEDLDDGDYEIVRVLRQASEDGRRGNTRGAYRLRWQGSLNSQGGRVKITRSFFEIEPGDLIIKDKFDIPVLSLQEKSLGEEGDSVNLIPVEEGAYIGVAAPRSVGAKFASAEEPAPGSIVTFKRGLDDFGRGVVLHRQGLFGTLWVFESKSEILQTDKLR